MTLPIYGPERESVYVPQPMLQAGATTSVTHIYVKDVPALPDAEKVKERNLGRDIGKFILGALLLGVAAPVLGGTGLALVPLSIVGLLAGIGAISAYGAGVPIIVISAIGLASAPVGIVGGIGAALIGIDLICEAISGK